MKKKYGEWTVMAPSSNKKYYSRCKCSCGVIKDVNNSTLRLGKSKSCGHDNGKAQKERMYEETDNKIVNQRFRRLVAIKRINATGISRYLCQCDCGNKVEVKASLLLTGGTMSCGCLRKDASAKSMEKIMQTGQEKIKEGLIEGTSVCTLNQKVSKNSATKVKGVSEMKNGKYRAYINLKREQRHLGTFDTIEEAQEARLQAEGELYGPILKKHKKHYPTDDRIKKN